MISDLCSNFKHFADQQCITPQAPYFNVGDKEIVYMLDPFHMLKAIRNNFFNYRLKSQTKYQKKLILQTFMILIKVNNIDLHLT